jgi:hypothetical protein
MNKCNYFSLLISRDVDNDLNQSEKNDLSYHLKTCKKCFRLHENFIKLKKTLNHDLPVYKKRYYIPGGLKIAIAACMTVIITASLFLYNNKIQNNKMANADVIEYPLGDLIYASEITNDFNVEAIYEPMDKYCSAIEQ